MQKFGCQIQAKLWPPISFMPYEAQLVSSSLKTIFSHGCHNVGAFNRQQDDIQNFIQMKTYALNPCDSATINPQDNQVIKFKLSLDNDTILKPGCPIVISSPDLTLDNCLQTVPQITKVQNNNSVSIRVFNNTPFAKELSAQTPVEGFKAQPLSIFKTPLQVTKEDIMIMAQINSAFTQASAADPTFLKAYVSSAARYNINPQANTDNQRNNRTHEARMRSTQQHTAKLFKLCRVIRLDSSMIRDRNFGIDVTKRFGDI